MYWRISSFPELAHLADAERRAMIRQDAGWKLTIKLVLRSLLGGFLTTALGCSIVIDLYPWQLSFLLAPLFFIPGSVIAYQYSIIRIRGQLIIFLEQAGRRERLPMCLKCGYNLEGSTGSRCPECGYRIDQSPKAETPPER